MGAGRLTVGVFWLSALGCAGLGPKTVPLERHDEAVLFRARDLAQVYDVAVSPRYASASKVQDFFGTWTLTYEYDATDATDVDPLYVTQVITWDPIHRDADTTYFAGRLGILANLDEGFTVDDEMLTGFARHECWSKRTEDGVLGVICLAKQGRVVAILSVAGVVLDGPLNALMGPQLEAMRTYHPTGADRRH